MTSTGSEPLPTTVSGVVASGFEPVRDAFAANFAQGLELGASCAVTLDGEFVVDLWGGDADTNGQPWERDTITNTFSVTKTMAAMCLLLLADRGDIDLNAAVATYWPEFAANGKATITVSHVLSHASGLSGFDPAIPNAEFLYDWDACCERLAAQTPWWEPGTASGYHAVTQGFLVGEIVRRVTGSSIGAFFGDEIAGPLGADFHIGLPETADHRVAELIPPTTGLGENAAGESTDSVAARTGASSRLSGHEANTRAWRAAELPAIGGVGNARSVARVHSLLACGGEVDGLRLMSEAGVEAAATEQISGIDLVNGVDLRWGNGFAINSEATPISPNPRAIFWAGWGGSFSVIDLDARVSVAYVMNKMADDPAADFRGGILAATALGCAPTN
jgi:CubicO group peptidase (beta-lactamase class C family)